MSQENPNPPQKSWQARIGEATDALAQSFVESISYDRRLYKHDIAGSIAHAAMLAKVGLVTEDERAKIEEGLRSIERDIEAGTFVFDEAMEDIHMVVEAALIDRLKRSHGPAGEAAARKLHTGRSRNDQVAADLLAWLQDASHPLQGGLNGLNKAFAALAARSVEIVMPAFTHLQRAQPISAGAECLGWARMFLQDVARLSDFRGQWREVPLGAGAVAGTSLPIDPGLVIKHWLTERALEVGDRGPMGLIQDQFDADAINWHYRRFTSPPASSIERTASRDAACDFLYACAMIAQHLSRWAEQWIIYMTTEFSFIRIADRYTTSSSMMPQKRNPDMLELIRGRCGNVYGDLFALMTILKGLPIGYNRDLQEDKRIVFRAYDTISSCLTMAAAIVNSASYDKDRIEPTLDRGFLDATSLAEYLVTKGVPFRTAHHVVGSLVAMCERTGRHSLGQLSLDEFRRAVADQGQPPEAVGQDVYDALGAKNVVKRYQSAGAAGGKPFEEQLAAWKKRLGIEG